MGICTSNRLDPDEEADATGTGDEFKQLAVFGKTQACLRAPADTQFSHPFKYRSRLCRIPQEIVIQKDHELSGKRTNFGEDIGSIAVAEAISEILGNGAKSAIV